MPHPHELFADGERYQLAGMLDKALDRFEAAAHSAESPALRSAAIRKQADVLRARCAWDEALEMARLAQQVAEENDLAEAAAEALNAEAAVHHSRGDLDLAAPLYRRMIDLTPDARIRGIALQNIGTIAAMHGDHTRAQVHFRDSYHSFEVAGYRRGMALALNNYGRSALECGNAGSAETILVDAEELALQLNDLDLAHMCKLNRAEAMLVRGCLDDAEMLVSQAVGHFGMSGNQWRRLECLRLLGDIGRLRQNDREAQLYYEAALAVARELGARRDIDALESRLQETKEI